MTHPAIRHRESEMDSGINAALRPTNCRYGTPRLRTVRFHDANDDLHDYKDFDASAFYGEEFYGNTE